MTMSSRTLRCFGALAMSAILASCMFERGGPRADSVRSSHAARQAPLALTYVANEGVLVSSGDSKVLIDALFDKPNPDYRAPSPDVLDKIMKGEAPFDGVDVALVTHNHPDHFDAPLAARYMATARATLMVAPADAVADMRKQAEWPKIERRIVALELAVGRTAKMDLKGVRLTAFRTLHSGDRESPMNLMYLVELDGWRVFHEGDPTGRCDAFGDFGAGSAPIDLALVHFWYALDPMCARFFQETVKPDHIALMHLPIRLEGDAPGKIDRVKASYKDMFLLLPGMETRVFQKEVPSGTSS
jgi:L-ascorbate metabolism protein UlaG (beta-lactamase superfamily)